MAPKKIRDRAAFFGKSEVVKINSKERRKLKRKPLQEEYKKYQERMNSKEQQLEERQDTRIVIPPPEISQVDLRIDPKEYEDFLRREKKLELMNEIKELERKIKEKRGKKGKKTVK